MGAATRKGRQPIKKAGKDGRPSPSPTRSASAPPISSADGQASIVYGINSVQELLTSQSASVHGLTILKGKTGPKLQRLIDLARKQGIPIRFTAEPAFKKYAGFNHQGVVAMIGTVPTLSLDLLLEKLAGLEGPPFLLALDSIQDPHNLGAIARSAAAASVDGLILPRHRSAPLSGAVFKVSAGAIAHVDVCAVTNLADCLKELREKGIHVLGAAAEDSRSLFQQDLAGPLCLVIGGEAAGLRPIIRKQCDGLLSIPMPGGINSLNAASAASVFLFEAVRQRTKG